MNIAVRLFAAAALVLCLTSAADAQEQKRTKQRQQQPTASSDFTGGMISCHGGVALIPDGGSVNCRRRDGKICTVRAGSSGYAEVGDCK